MNKNVEEKISQLQIIEQNLQEFFLQKQNFQNQLMEVNAALEELNKSKDDCYKLIGNIMFKEEKGTLIKDLNNKKDILELRIKNIEKQEKKIKEQATSLQKEVVSSMKNDK